MFWRLPANDQTRFCSQTKVIYVILRAAVLDADHLSFQSDKRNSRWIKLTPRYRLTSWCCSYPLSGGFDLVRGAFRIRPHDARVLVSFSRMKGRKCVGHGTSKRWKHSFIECQCLTPHQKRNIELDREKLIHDYLTRSFTLWVSILKGAVSPAVIVVLPQLSAKECRCNSPSMSDISKMKFMLPCRA